MADPKPGNSPAKATILCVDDEENPLTLRKLVLQNAGYAVLTARSANQALEILSSRKVDLVLSDLLMPGKTGTELAREIKTSTPHLPVILISGVNEIPPDASYADMFLSKVEGPVAMCEKIAAVLQANSN
ncbi:MAG: response regulator [Candidatus Angelobacter sp. Gp1-AA117]|nr:MAG: response regulator [Candidatus Angelobacter sp. Gp1-AA117]